MNRIFGRGKPKEPPPNMSDMITKVSDALSNDQDLPLWLTSLEFH